MFIKNYSDTDLTINYKGGTKTLEAKDVTYVDDKWISFPLVFAMFGYHVGLVEGETPIEEFLFDNQLLAENNKVYQVIKVGPGTPRVQVKDGKATLYFADLEPEDIEKDMFPSPQYTDIEGLMLLNEVTRYIAVKCDEGAKVIFTNVKVG